METKVLEGLDVFVDTVRAGCFSAGARQRGLVASSVARQIDALEAQLQVPLFTRSTRALVPTRAGELLFHRAIRILEDLAATRREVTASDHQVQGVLQVSCLPTFGRRYVLPCVNQLLSAHPSLRIELDFTERLTDPTTERQDAAIRFGQQPDSKLIATRIGIQPYVICAAPSHVATYGIPPHREALRAHRLIDKRHRASALGWRAVLGQHRLGQTAFVLECDDLEAQRAAAVAGSGIARLPDWVVGPDVVAGSLTELAVADIWEPETGVYLMRALPKQTATLSAFSQCLQDFIGPPPVWRCQRKQEPGQGPCRSPAVPSGLLEGFLARLLHRRQRDDQDHQPRRDQQAQ